MSSAETVANMVSGSKGSEEIVPVRQQANYELNFRSFATKHPQEGKRGHVVDAERDRARCDRRFARSTAQLTPQLFHEEISRRSCNVSTATIEEVDAELITPPEDPGRLGAKRTWWKMRWQIAQLLAKCPTALLQLGLRNAVIKQHRPQLPSRSVHRLRRARRSRRRSPWSRSDHCEFFLYFPCADLQHGRSPPA